MWLSLHGHGCLAGNQHQVVCLCWYVQQVQRGGWAERGGYQQMRVCPEQAQAVALAVGVSLALCSRNNQVSWF